jgi:hypothetical protein
VALGTDGDIRSTCCLHLQGQSVKVGGLLSRIGASCTPVGTVDQEMHKSTSLLVFFSDHPSKYSPAKYYVILLKINWRKQWWGDHFNPEDEGSMTHNYMYNNARIELTSVVKFARRLRPRS